MFEKMKGMSKKEKAQYFWDYYKWPVIGILAGAILLFCLVRTIVKNVTVKEVATVVVINAQTTEDTDGLQEIFDEILTDYGFELKHNTVEVLSGIYVGDEFDSQTDLVGTARLEAYMTNKQDDVMLCGDDYLNTLLEYDVFADLSQILPEDVLAAHESDLIYVTIQDTGESYPALIYVDPGSDLLQTAGWYGDDDKVAAGIGRNAKNTEVAMEIVLKALGE